MEASVAGRRKRGPPAYVRAQDAVLKLVRAEGLQPGAKVPSERTLAMQLGLSRMTVRQGVQNLVRAGILERDGNSGTRVADISVVRVMDSRRAFSMTEMVRSSGARPGGQLLMFASAAADRDVAVQLHLEAGAAVVKMRRLRLADDVPFCIEMSCIPAALVPGLVAEDLAQNASLYSVLRDRYGLVPTDRDSQISVAPIAAEDAVLLGVAEGLNVLMYRSVVRDASARPIESVMSVNHPQRVVFSTHSMQLKRQSLAALRQSAATPSASGLVTLFAKCELLPTMAGGRHSAAANTDCQRCGAAPSCRPVAGDRFVTPFNRELNCLAPSDAPSRPIWAVRPSGLDTFLAGMSPPQAAFLHDSGFAAEAERLVLVPDPSGLAGAVLGLGEARDPFGFGGLAAALPKGTVWRLEPGDFDAGDATLGFCLGAYRPEGAPPAAGAPAARLVAAAATAALRTARAAWMVRDLINAPANRLGPADLAAAAAEIGRGCGAEASVVAGEALAREYPTIAAVGAGSERAPRVGVLRWHGSRAHADAPLVSLCGKGVCFDSGGYDLKPSSGMLRMKKDMGGAAIALGIARLVMEADLPVRLALRLGCVENSVSGRAMRPLDVVCTRRGLSVEIGNTDAEGRLVLCDLVAEASDEQPALLLDLATLTGAARVALGPDLPALFCNDDAWAAALLVAGETEADPLWRLPLWSGYDKWLASPMADLTNVASKPMAGAVVAALFLQRFLAPGTPWAHLDVYAWNEQTRPGRPEGGEAQAMRAVVAAIAGRFGGTDQDRNMRFT